MNSSLVRSGFTKRVSPACYSKPVETPFFIFFLGLKCGVKRLNKSNLFLRQSKRLKVSLVPVYYVGLISHLTFML